MYCPDCNQVNLPGAAQCDSCGHKLLDVQSTFSQAGLEIQEQIMTTKIRDLLRPETNQEIGPEATIDEAIELLRSHNASHGCILVVDDQGTFQGILTERDIVIHCSEEPDSCKKLKVKDIYSRNRPVLSCDNSLNYAVHQMAISGYRHLAIARKEEVVGFINVKDILEQLCQGIDAL